MAARGAAASTGVVAELISAFKAQAEAFLKENADMKPYLMALQLAEKVFQLYQTSTTITELATQERSLKVECAKIQRVVELAGHRVEIGAKLKQIAEEMDMIRDQYLNRYFFPLTSLGCNIEIVRS